jgi:hypothetical protein
MSHTQLRRQRASVPDTLAIHMEYTGKRQVGVKNAGLAAKVGQTVFDSLANGLFVNRDAVPVPATAQPMSSWRARKQAGAGAVLQCSFNGYAVTPPPSLWQFNRADMAMPEDRWVFASDCAERLSGIFEDTPLLREGSRPGADVYTSGRNYITHDQLIGHIAGQLDLTRLPRSDEDVAGTFARLGTAICWAVTGSNNMPPVEFTTVTY